MKNLHDKLVHIISTDDEYTTSFLRGLFAAEGQVALKRYGTLFYVSIASTDMNVILFTKKCLEMLGIVSGKYMLNGRKFPIYGYRNLKRFRELGIHTLHPEKREKFERGSAAYKRIDVLDCEKARAQILHQLAFGPKTYDELAAALGKARTTIQSHHIPILEKQGLIERAGKHGQAWLWKLAKPPTIIHFEFTRSKTQDRAQ